MIPYSDALVRLREGNARFLSGQLESTPCPSPEERAELALKQEPFAIILGCADSRVPAELIFDQGHGDLFVTRVAGNIPAPSQVGSIEFAAEHFGSKLIVVLGHTACGAIKAGVQRALDADSSPAPSPGIGSLLEVVQPVAQSTIDQNETRDFDELVALAGHANIRSSVEQLKQSAILAGKIDAGEVAIIGAEYSLETGKVEFLEESAS